MKHLSLVVAPLLVLMVNLGHAQNPISVVDFVKVEKDRQKEALFYYENNWKVFRDIALDKGYIQSYSLLSTSADTTADFDLILITEYKDSLQFNMSEQRFHRIIEEVRPNKSMLLNEMDPKDFRKNQYYKIAELLFSPQPKE